MIIHGSGLLDGSRVPKLLQDRLDKAIEVYQKDPTPPTLIPSGGQGEDESIPEAEAMRQYLVSKGLPERDIIPETVCTQITEEQDGSFTVTLETNGEQSECTAFYIVYDGDPFRLNALFSDAAETYKEEKISQRKIRFQ